MSISSSVTARPSSGRRDADRSLRARAAGVIPSGAFGHLDVGRTSLPPAYPQFFARGEGPRVWDVDGNAYVDLMCSFGPMVIGHRHSEVEAAVSAQAARGDCLNGPTPRTVELAELLVDTVAHADWATFAKNGTDVTTLACTIARAATGRRKVLRAAAAYHGASPPFTPIPAGTTPEDRVHLVPFTYNDLADAHDAAARHDGDVAAVIVTPFQHDGFGDQQAVDPDFARGLRALCDRIGAVLILDEIRTGFRFDLAGSWERLGVRPDLSAFGKALGNGHPVAAVTGIDGLRAAVSEVYATGSFWYAGSAHAAAIATLDVLRRGDALPRMHAAGQRLRAGLAERAEALDLTVVQSGPVEMPFLRFADDQGFELANLFTATALEGGAYLHPWHNWFLSGAHDNHAIDQVLSAAERAFAAVAEPPARDCGRVGQ